MQLDIRNQAKLLSELLAESGMPLDMRCGGVGRCGRCRVQLLTGTWQQDNQRLTAPCEALACRTRLVSETGRVEITPSALLPATKGKVADGWQTDSPMPVSPEVTIGIDIGTTTLAAAALCEGRVVARVSRYNPQSLYGDNVISRISAAKEHLLDMRNVLLEALRGMLQALPVPKRVAIAGNSTMMCIFHGIDPSPLGQLPFTVPQRQFNPIPGDCLGLASDILVDTVPLLTAYLGGDILGGIGEVALQPGDFFIDIGTNCEMVFRTPDGNYYGTAAAAGPAFEGAGLSCGVRAVPGAISKYRGENDFDVISSGPPTGICGSGMIDFLAVENTLGHLSPFGRFQPSSPTRPIAGDLTLSESDVEQLLKAKAAVFAGIQTLEQHCGTPCRRLVLAGGFAQFIDLSNAIAIGLLPERECRIVGNTSLASAVRLAADSSYMDRLLKLQDAIPEIPLNTIPDFEDNFIDAMMLP